jgi:hypothetical protein
MLSILILLFEIKHSKYSTAKDKNNIRQIKLPKMSSFSYKSKCADLKNVMQHLDVLEDNLKDEMDISHMKVAKIPIDNYFEILISLEFEWNNHESIDKVVHHFNGFTNYLDSISYE